MIQGSGQQSVTGMSDALDANSYWQVRGSMKKDCVRGTPIKCGQTIRLTHVSTRRNLHSHHFQAPMSAEQVTPLFMTSLLFATAYCLDRFHHNYCISLPQSIRNRVGCNRILVSQEVSAFGDDGNGDSLDEWVVQCDGKNWSRKDAIRFKHKETQAYLTCTGGLFGLLFTTS